jgi:phage/plasmid-like protein (TIGR03299 family)
MSHDLFTENGKASMFYVGDDVPWHKLGTKLDNPATAEEAIQAAKLDYPVELRPLRAMLKGRRVLDVPKNFATVRMDTEEVLSVVGSRYEVIQNVSAFSFFDGLVDRDEAIYHTAGVLGKGERCWILAKLPGYIRVGKNDEIEKFALLVNSHDGSTPTLAKMTSIRVVCSNTLSAAIQDGEQTVSIRHTANAREKLEEAHKILGLYNSLYAELEVVFNQMALKKLKPKDLVEYCKQLIPDNPDADSNTRTENMRGRILELHESGLGAELHKGTAFGIYNAVTELVDHAEHNNPDRHLKSIWFGSGERLKQKAFTLAKDLLSN